MSLPHAEEHSHTRRVQPPASAGAGLRVTAPLARRDKFDLFERGEESERGRARPRRDRRVRPRGRTAPWLARQPIRLEGLDDIELGRVPIDSFVLAVDSRSRQARSLDPLQCRHERSISCRVFETERS